MSTDSRYRTNCPPIVDETLDGESIIVNLEAGTYYALVGAASYVWELLGTGAGIDDLVSQVATVYGVEEVRVREDLVPLLEELECAGLVIVAGPPATDAQPAAPTPGPGPYAAPVLTTYTDMQELLALDPVHEVDDAGWPSRL